MKNIFLIALLMVVIILPNKAQVTESFTPPVNGIVEKKLNKERRVLPYAPIREADIMWEKRIWRVIDTREKINLPFRYPRTMLFNVLMEGIKKDELQAYAVTDADDFSTPLPKEELLSFINKKDTISVYDHATNSYVDEIIVNETDPDNIKRFRIKEIWYFDENTSTMKVRILGIAPLQDVYDDHGNFLYELPLFWVYYPHARQALSQALVFNGNNDNAPMSFTDIFEMRMFSSYIYKESNVHDRRLEGYLSSVDLLLEGKKINDEIFNFEHDLWEY